jgi:hypothetical protein
MAVTTQEHGNGKEAKGGVSPSVKLASFITVVALIAYGVAVWLMWGKADTAQEPEWTRLVFLLTGIEAITFAAIGWLFGREVNRVRAEKAEEKEAESRVEADAANREAASVKATGRAIRRALEPGEAGDLLGPGSVGGGAQGTISAIRNIAADFPDE